MGANVSGTNGLSINLSLLLTDGSVGSAFFLAGNGISVIRQGAQVGELSQAELDRLARMEQAGERVADRVAEFLSPHELTAQSRLDLTASALDWIQAHAF